MCTSGVTLAAIKGVIFVGTSGVTVGAIKGVIVVCTSGVAIAVMKSVTSVSTSGATVEGVIVLPTPAKQMIISPHKYKWRNCHRYK